MRPELDDKLCETYPKIFRDRHLPMTHTAMCWGFDCGDGWYNIIETLCECIQSHIDNTRKERALALRFNRALKRARAGDSRGLIKYYDLGYSQDSREYAESRAQRALDTNEDYRVVPEACGQVVTSQVKEKFGGLRFYHYGGDRTVDGMVRLAEILSYKVCETCGAPGRVQGKTWRSTRCEAHSENT